MAAIKAQLIISEAGRTSLARAGVSPAWLSAWLQSMGAAHVRIQGMEDESWKQAEDWQIFFGLEAELMRAALFHGRRIQANADGSRRLTDTKAMPMNNPGRIAWHYRHGDKDTQTVLLPLGDVAYQRHLWLSPLAAGQAMLPMRVWLGDEGGQELEPGLRGQVVVSPDTLSHVEYLLNDGGYLPEEQLLFLLREKGWGVCFAESCTGGGLCERMSRMPGSSDVLDRGWVTYSNQAKSDMLGVTEKLLARHGAVSRETVEAMADAGRDLKHACVAVSGIAGPGGSTEDKPVGTVWIAAALPEERPVSQQFHFSGSRADIRTAVVNAGLGMLILGLKGEL